MIQIFSEDIEFLKELYKNKSVSMYFFHEKYRLSPAQLGRTIRKFLQINCITLNNDIIELTENGTKWILANRIDLFLKSKKKYWKMVPENMSQEPLKTNDIYLPNINKLDKEIFKELEDGE